jgi:hypothetical protein
MKMKRRNKRKKEKKSYMGWCIQLGCAANRKAGTERQTTLMEKNAIASCRLPDGHVDR